MSVVRIASRLVVVMALRGRTLAGSAVADSENTPFDQKAAIEAAIATRDALNRGGLRVDATNPDVTKTKIKFDRQIVAIAKAEGAHSVYSDDDDVHSYAQRAGLKVFRTADLDLPPENPQMAMELTPPENR